MGRKAHYKELYKDQALKAAKELCYGYEVMDRIRAAKTDEEIRRIMETERHRKK